MEPFEYFTVSLSVVVDISLSFSCFGVRSMLRGHMLRGHTCFGVKRMLCMLWGHACFGVRSCISAFPIGLMTCYTTPLMFAVLPMFRLVRVASALTRLTACGFRPRHKVAAIEGYEDTNAPSAAACACIAPKRRPQFQYPRVSHAGFKCAMHHSPCFYLAQVLRLGF